MSAFAGSFVKKPIEAMFPPLYEVYDYNLVKQYMNLLKQFDIYIFLQNLSTFYYLISRKILCKILI